MLREPIFSRQYFEEKKSTKLTMPSWQLQGASLNGTADEQPNTNEVISSQTNGLADEVESNKSKACKDAAVESGTRITNGEKGAENCDAIKESDTNKSPSEKKKEMKKTKNNLKN